jgi:hypothetical protein
MGVFDFNPGEAMSKPSSLKWQLAILAVVAMVGSVWAQQPPSAYTSSLTKAKATVTALNPATREITVTGDKGPTTVVAGPEVKNFNNLKVGDQVLLSYYEGALAQIVKGSKKVADPAVSAFSYGNSPGMKPAGGAGLSATITVKIEDINLPTNTAAYKKSDGSIHIVQVKTPEMQKFLRELKPGDTVQLTVTESLAVEVIPAS